MAGRYPLPHREYHEDLFASQPDFTGVAMLIIYGLSYSLFLFEVDSIAQPWVGTAGWFLFVVLLTEMNDIMQAIVGRKFGKRKITPIVSPNKSLEGLVGGLVTTIVLSITLSPWMTTITRDRNPFQGISLSVMCGRVDFAGRFPWRYPHVGHQT